VNKAGGVKPLCPVPPRTKRWHVFEQVMALKEIDCQISRYRSKHHAMLGDSPDFLDRFSNFWLRQPTQRCFDHCVEDMVIER
jgi:hypothetical protein